VQPRRGSAPRGTPGASSSPSSDQAQRPAASGGSQDATQSSDSQQRPQQGSSQSTSSSQDNKTGSGDGRQRSTTGSTADSSQQQSTQSGSASSPQQSGSAAQQNNATQQSTTQQSGTAQQDSTSASSNATSSTSTNSVANLNTEQRSEVTQAFSSTSVNTVSNVNFNVSVGTTITEEVRLAPLPAEVVRIVPQYRNYQYVVVRDEIVIVEPRTKKIVEVIRKSGGSRKSASVNLSSEQRRKFKTTVETTGSTRRSTSTKVEIREGVTLPEEIEIMEVPQTIVTEVPELRTYRYVVVGDEVALIEPETRRVIQVIE